MVQYSNLKIVMVWILLSLFTVSTFGQSRSFSRDQMARDIDTLFSTIEKVHPDMCAFYPKQQLEKDIEKVKFELKPNGDIFYFYKQVTPLVVKLGDGHTFVYSDEFEDFANVKFSPLSVKITYPDREIFVRDDYKTIPANAKILSINNRSSDSIVQEMMNYSSGEKDFFRISRLEPLFVNMLYVLYGDTIFNIEYLHNQEKRSAQIKAFSLNKASEIVIQQNSITPSELYTFKTLPDKNIGIIEFNSFEDLDKFKLFLDSTFQVLQNENIENLIIDLRKNGGGDSGLGDEMFQYISHVPFAQYGISHVKISDILKQIIKKKYNFEVPNPNGLEIGNQIHLEELRENPLRYNGNVFLLISHYTFSSAAGFSWAFKYFKMGTVIGEESGGMAVCFGDVIPLKLPETGLRYGCSYKKFYQYGATDENVHGTLPDYYVKSEQALEFTIDLINQKK